MIEKYALFKVFDELRKALEEVSVRGLARNAGIGSSTSKMCLDYLFEKRIATRKIIGNLYQYKLNNENALARQLKIAASLAEIQDSGMAAELAKKCPELVSVVLYGSVAEGIDNAKSDIDLLMVSRAKLKTASFDFEKKLNREISFVRCTMQEWREKAAKEKAFYESVIIKGIALFGELPVVK
jgi:predicted nucleotidyltransferase